MYYQCSAINTNPWLFVLPKMIHHILNHVILYFFSGELEPLETSVDLCNVLTSGAKFCKHCDTAVQANMVKYNKSELEALLTNSEKQESHHELYFCDEHCYFQFAIGRADKVSYLKKNKQEFEN